MTDQGQRGLKKHLMLRKTLPKRIQVVRIICFLLKQFPNLVGFNPPARIQVVRIRTDTDNPDLQAEAF